MPGLAVGGTVDLVNLHRRTGGVQLHRDLELIDVVIVGHARRAARVLRHHEDGLLGDREAASLGEHEIRAAGAKRRRAVHACAAAQRSDVDGEGLFGRHFIAGHLLDDVAVGVKARGDDLLIRVRVDLAALDRVLRCVGRHIPRAVRVAPIRLHAGGDVLFIERALAVGQRDRRGLVGLRAVLPRAVHDPERHGDLFGLVRDGENAGGLDHVVVIRHVHAVRVLDDHITAEHAVVFAGVRALGAVAQALIGIAGQQAIRRDAGDLLLFAGPLSRIALTGEGDVLRGDGQETVRHNEFNVGVISVGILEILFLEAHLIGTLVGALCNGRLLRGAGDIRKVIRMLRAVLRDRDRVAAHALLFAVVRERSMIARDLNDDLIIDRLLHPLGNQRNILVEHDELAAGGSIAAVPAGEIVALLRRDLVRHADLRILGVIQRREVALLFAAGKIIRYRVALDRGARRRRDLFAVQHHLRRIVRAAVGIGRDILRLAAGAAGHDRDLDDQLLALTVVHVIGRIVVAGHADRLAVNADLYGFRRFHRLGPAVRSLIRGVDLDGRRVVRIQREIVGDRIDHGGLIVQVCVRSRRDLLADLLEDIVQVAGAGSSLVIAALVRTAVVYPPFIRKYKMVNNFRSSLRIVGGGRAHIAVGRVVSSFKHTDRIDRGARRLQRPCLIDDTRGDLIIKVIAMIRRTVGEHNNDLRVLRGRQRGFRLFHAVVRRRSASRLQAADSRLQFVLAGLDGCQLLYDLGVIVGVSPIPIRIVADRIRLVSGKLHDGNVALGRALRNSVDEAVDRGFQRIQLLLPLRSTPEIIIHRAGNIQHEGNVQGLLRRGRGRFPGRIGFHRDGIGAIIVGHGRLCKRNSRIIFRERAYRQQAERHDERHQNCHKSSFHAILSLHHQFPFSRLGAAVPWGRIGINIMPQGILFVNRITCRILLTAAAFI